MSCPPKCPVERKKQHSKSISLVCDNEYICRAGFVPMHYKNNGKVNNSILKATDLVKNNLSFWRIKNINDENEFSVIIKKIPIPRKDGKIQSLNELFCIKVVDVRSFKMSGFRLYHVLDDCKTDMHGSFDVLHCTVGLCDKIKVAENEPSSPLNPVFFTARNSLVNLITKKSKIIPCK